MPQQDNSIYTGGAALFNAQPYVAFQTNLLAHEAAKNEALDNSYKDLNKNLTPAGMKANDVPGFMSKVNDIQNFYTQNRDNIVNPKSDNGASQMKYNAMYNDALGDVETSKRAVDDLKAIQTSRMSGKWNATTNDLDVSNKIAAPIHDKTSLKPDGTRYSASDLSLNVPDFDSKMQGEFENTVYGGTNKIVPVKNYDVTGAVTDKNTGLVTVPYTSAYTPQQIKQIGTNAANTVGGVNSPSYIAYERKLSDPNFALPANVAYQAIHGKDAVVDTPQKAAEADYLMRAKAYQEKGTDKPQNNEVYLEGVKEANRKSLADYNREQTTPNLQAVIDDQVKNGKPEMTTGEVIKDNDGNPIKAAVGQPTGGIILNVSQPIRDVLARRTPVLNPQGTTNSGGDDISGKQAVNPITGQPMYQTVPLNNDKPIVKLKDGRFQINYSDGSGSIIDNEGYKGALAASKAYDSKPKQQQVKPDKSGVIVNSTSSGGNHSSSQNQQQSGVATYKTSDLKSKGWTDGQIKQAIKSGKIKVQ